MPKQVEAPAQPAQPQAQPAAAPSATDITSSLGEFAQFLSKDRIDEIAGAAKQQSTPPPAQPAPAVDKNQPAASAPSEGGDEPDEGTAAHAAEGGDKPAGEAALAEPVKKNIFGINKNQGKAFTIEKPEDMLEVVKKNFGQEYKDVKELGKFFETAQSWRKSAEKAKEIEEKHTKLTAELNNLPEVFFEAFGKLAAGEDFTQPFLQKKAIDFNLPAEKQDIKKLVNHYFPGKFSDQDFAETEEGKSEKLEIAEEAAKQRFLVEKGVYEGERAQAAQRAKDRLEAQKAAVLGSVNTLKQRFPEMDTDVVNEARSIMEGGAQKILSLFLDKNGAVTPDAAIRVVMALHGETELLPHYMEVSAKQAESKITEDIVSRGADSPKPTRTGTQPPELLNKEVKEQIDEWKTLGDKTKSKTY